MRGGCDANAISIQIKHNRARRLMTVRTIAARIARRCITWIRSQQLTLRRSPVLGCKSRIRIVHSPHVPRIYLHDLRVAVLIR